MSSPKFISWTEALDVAERAIEGGMFDELILDWYDHTNPASLDDIRKAWQFQVFELTGYVVGWGHVLSVRLDRYHKLKGYK